MEYKCDSYLLIHLNCKIKNIPTKILDEVRKGNCKLIFDNTLEGKSINGDKFLNPFYKSIDKLKLPTKNIIGSYSGYNQFLLISYLIPTLHVSTS